MLYYEPKPQEGLCAGRLCWIWGGYAIAMLWLWDGLSAAGLPGAAIWALAGLAGACVLQATREI